jgi:hypothetical protein
MTGRKAGGGRRCSVPSEPGQYVMRRGVIGRVEGNRVGRRPWNFPSAPHRVTRKLLTPRVLGAATAEIQRDRFSAWDKRLRAELANPRHCPSQFEFLGLGNKKNAII